MLCLFSCFFFTQFSSFIDLLFLTKICHALWTSLSNLIQQPFLYVIPALPGPRTVGLPWQIYSKAIPRPLLVGTGGLWNSLLTATQLTSSSRQNGLRKYNKTLDLPVKDLSAVRRSSMVHDQDSKHLNIHSHMLAYENSNQRFSDMIDRSDFFQNKIHLEIHCVYVCVGNFFKPCKLITFFKPYFKMLLCACVLIISDSLRPRGL